MIGQLFVSSIKLFDGFGSLGYKGRDLMQKKKKKEEVEKLLEPIKYQKVFSIWDNLSLTQESLIN